MKKIILLIVIGLLVSVSYSQSENSDTIKIVPQPFTMCFFNLDSLNSQLYLFKEIEEEMIRVGIEAEKKMKKKQAEITAWEQKWASKGTLLSSEQGIYGQESIEIQNDAIQFEQNVQFQLQEDQALLMEMYARKLSYFTELFCKRYGYDVIFTYQFGQSPWYYNKKYDVTDQLAKIINGDYNK